MGDSRGHWEGDTLVIESSNFNAKVGLTLNGNSTPTSQKLKIVERLTRIDQNTIQYQACHEGNYGMRNILSGARAEEAGK